MTPPCTGLLTTKKSSRCGTSSRRSLAVFLENPTAVNNKPMKNFLGTSKHRTRHQRHTFETSFAMSEEDKLRHLFEELSHSLFSAIASMPPTKVEMFIADCKRFEDLHSGQIFSTAFDRLVEVSPSPLNGSVTISFHDVIRNEFQTFLARLLPQLPGNNTKMAVSGIGRWVWVWGVWKVHFNPTLTEPLQRCSVLFRITSLKCCTKELSKSRVALGYHR